MQFMRNKLIISLILISLTVIISSCELALLGGASDGGGDDLPPLPPGKIEGTWSSEDDINISSLKVILTDGDHFVIDKTYNYLTGAYFFEDVPVGYYAVIIDIQDLYWEIVENISVHPDETSVVDNINLRTIKATAPLVPSIVNIVNYDDNVSSRFRMEGSNFIDGFGDDSHHSTRWQLSTGEHFLSSSLVFDELTTSDLLLFNPEIILSYGFIYYCRVKHIDSSLEESRWSDTIVFTTEIDLDNDGISDKWEDDNDLTGDGDMSPISDPDGDNIPNRFEYYFGLDPYESDSTGSSGLQPAVYGSILDYKTSENIVADIIVRSDIGRTIARTADESGYFGVHPYGTFNISIFTVGYYPRIFRNIFIPETDVHNIDFILIPMNYKDKYIPTDDDDPDPYIDPNNGGSDDTGCFIIPLIHASFSN